MIGEPELADLVRSISKNVAPVLRKGGADLQARLAVCIDGPEAPLCERLDKLIEERWSELHRKMRALADAGGWRP